MTTVIPSVRTEYEQNQRNHIKNNIGHLTDFYLSNNKKVQVFFSRTQLWGENNLIYIKMTTLSIHYILKRKLGILLSEENGSKL